MIKKKFKHTELNRKRSHPKAGLLASDEQIERITEIQSDDEWESILQLCDDYGIKNDDDFWMNLALALARDFIPAFQEKQRRGPKIKWTDYRRAVPVVEITRLIEARSCTAATAANLLAEASPWKETLQVKDKYGEIFPDPGEALRHIYYESKDQKLATAARGAFRWNKQRGALSDWEASVAQVFDD